MRSLKDSHVWVFDVIQQHISRPSSSSLPLYCALQQSLEIQEIKVVFIAQYPVRWTAQSASHFLPSLADLFIPTPTPGRILAMQQLSATTKSLTFPPLLIARYSFIQLWVNWGVNGESEKAQSSKRYQRGIRTRAHLIVSPAFYHWATALHFLYSLHDWLLGYINWT